jgi:hypothetical protein
MQQTPTDGAAARPPAAAGRTLVIALAAVVACGVLLRLWQFGADAALWLDEIAIARNVLERPLASLLSSPLDYDQSAPKGFLAAEKLTVSVGGPGELALRAWPLASSIAALALMAVLAVRMLDGLGAVVAVAGLALATPLITQATEVKQYSSDVAAALVLMLLASPPARGGRRFDVLAGIGGAVAIWFSQPAVLLADAMLYDLSDGARLERATAATFATQGSYARTAQACTEGPIAMTSARSRITPPRP